MPVIVACFLFHVPCGRPLFQVYTQPTSPVLRTFFSIPAAQLFSRVGFLFLGRAWIPSPARQALLCFPSTCRKLTSSSFFPVLLTPFDCSVQKQTAPLARDLPEVLRLLLFFPRRITSPTKPIDVNGPPTTFFPGLYVPSFLLACPKPLSPPPPRPYTYLLPSFAVGPVSPSRKAQRCLFRGIELEL